MRTLDLVNKLDERDKEVQQLLLAGEAIIQSTNCSDSGPSNFDDESPMGFQWDVPDFPDVLESCESLLAKRVLPEDSPDCSPDCSPVKRTRSQYGRISQEAKGLASMMAGMTRHLAQLSDPKYLDDLLALQTCSPEPEGVVGKPSDDLESLSEVEQLRRENQKLQAENAEMSGVLRVMEDRLSMSNQYLKDAVASEEAKKPKSCQPLKDAVAFKEAKNTKPAVRCGTAMPSLKTQRRPNAVVHGR
jgi:hypothetical protein